MICSSCGADLPPHSDFCPYCGTQIGGTDKAQAPDPPQSEAGPWGTPGDDAAMTDESGASPEDAALGADRQTAPWPADKETTPRSSLKEPPRARMALWKTLTLWTVTIAVLSTIGWGALGLWRTSYPVRAVTKHLDMVMKRNLRDAYLQTAERFQQQTPERDYLLFLNNSPSLTQFAYYTVGARDMDGDNATVELTLTDRRGDDSAAVFDLIRQDGTWRIIHIRLGADAEMEPAPVTVKASEPQTSEDPSSRKSTEEEK